MTEVFIVPTARVGEVWHRASVLLEKAVSLTDGRYTLETVRQDVESGNQQLFLAQEGKEIIGACTTRLAKYPNDLRLIVVHCGGSHLERWFSQGMSEIERWAVQNDCSHIEIKGRREWARLLNMRITGCTMERACGRRTANQDTDSHV